MDDMGTFSHQRTQSAKKAIQMAGWVLHTLRSRDLQTMRTLWRSLVQPHQDYASQLWSPVGKVGDLLRQEAPLRSFTRRINGLQSLSYWERLKKVGLLSVERQMERYKIIYT